MPLLLPAALQQKGGFSGLSCSLPNSVSKRRWRGGAAGARRGTPELNSSRAADRTRHATRSFVRLLVYNKCDTAPHTYLLFVV